MSKGVWALMYDVVLPDRSEYQEHDVGGLASEAACRALYAKIAAALGRGDYIAQAIAEGPGGEEVVLKRFSEDGFSVWEDLARGYR